MREERFEEFATLISGVYWDIQRLKARNADALGLKQVHIFWVYLLRSHPEGLTASELARLSLTDRSLVSREISALSAQGYIQTDQATPRRRYGWKFRLTEKGEETARRISGIALSVQRGIDAGVSREQLTAFYDTLRVLQRNLSNLTEEESHAR